MFKLTESLHQFLFKNYKDDYGLIILGHVELFTEEMQREYEEWCKTDEAKPYLEGGALYKEPW